MNLQPRQQSKQPVFCLLVALLLLVAASAGLSAAEPKPAVRLVVDYGDGVQVHYTALPWQAGMTVVDALVAAQKHPHGLKLSQKGKGTSTLITEIGGLKNEASGKNWLFSVNGKQADVGAGGYELKSGDNVLWEFKAYEYNQ
jgi:hypothetical protein